MRRMWPLSVLVDVLVLHRGSMCWNRLLGSHACRISRETVETGYSVISQCSSCLLCFYVSGVVLPRRRCRWRRGGGRSARGRRGSCRRPRGAQTGRPNGRRRRLLTNVSDRTTKLPCNGPQRAVASHAGQVLVHAQADLSRVAVTAETWREAAARAAPQVGPGPLLAAAAVVQDGHGVDGVAVADDHLHDAPHAAGVHVPGAVAGPHPHHDCPAGPLRRMSRHIISKKKTWEHRVRKTSVLYVRMHAARLRCAVQRLQAVCSGSIASCVLHCTYRPITDRREREGGRAAGVQPLQRTLANGDGLVVRRALLAVTGLGP